MWLWGYQLQPIMGELFSRDYSVLLSHASIVNDTIKKHLKKLT